MQFRDDGIGALQTADLLAYEFTHCRADRSEYTQRLRQLATIDCESCYFTADFVRVLSAG
jgi:hypothetical protein